MAMDGRWRPVLATERLEGERWCNVFQLNVTLCVEGKVQRTTKRTELITVVMDLKDVTLRACSVEFI